MRIEEILKKTDIEWSWGLHHHRPVVGGLRFFYENKLGLWAVADNSGPYPDRTDDGVVWFDREGTVVLGNSKYGVTCGMRVWIHRTGKESWVTFDLETGWWLFNHFSTMKLELGKGMHLVYQMVQLGDARRAQEGKADAEADDEGDVSPLHGDHGSALGSVDDTRSPSRALSDLTSALELATQHVLRGVL